MLQANEAEQTIQRLRLQILETPRTQTSVDHADCLAQAEKAFRMIEQAASSAPADPVLVGAKARAEAALAEIREIAGEAEEQHRRDEVLRSWRVRAYLKARRVTLPASFRALAFSARQMQRVPPENLAEVVRTQAELAFLLSGAWDSMAVDSTSPLLPTPLLAVESPPDWEHIAKTVESWATDEPAEAGLMIGFSYLTAGRTELALAELERVEEARIRNEHVRLLAPFLRALVYQRAGLPRLSARALESLPAEHQEVAQLQAMAHMFLAYDLGRNRQWIEADRQLACAVRAWPDDPTLLLLSSERMVANGQKDQALETLERAQAMSAAERRVFKLIAARIQEVRTSSGPPPPLLIEPTLLAQLGIEALRDRAESSPLAQRVIGFLEKSGSRDLLTVSGD